MIPFVFSSTPLSFPLLSLFPTFSFTTPTAPTLPPPRARPKFLPCHSYGSVHLDEVDEASTGGLAQGALGLRTAKGSLGVGGLRGEVVEVHRAWTLEPQESLGSAGGGGNEVRTVAVVVVVVVVVTGAMTV